MELYQVLLAYVIAPTSTVALFVKTYFDFKYKRRNDQKDETNFQEQKFLNEQGQITIKRLQAQIDYFRELFEKIYKENLELKFEQSIAKIKKEREQNENISS